MRTRYADIVCVALAVCLSLSRSLVIQARKISLTLSLDLSDIEQVLETMMRLAHMKL